jgi:thiolase-like protein
VAAPSASACLNRWASARCARSLRGGGVCCRLEAFGECREIADAVLELAHEREGVLAYGVEREAGWLRGDVAQDELERQEKRYGLATLCIGGGMGIATIVERV